MGRKRIAYHDLNQVPDKVWQDLFSYTYFFGHQSVGNNILDGLSILLNDHYDKPIEIIESSHWENMGPASFAHSVVGENTRPVTKIEAFESLMHNELGDKVNVAFFKFCYVDINQDSDIDALFSAYQTSMDNLQRRYLKTKFIHFTVPLTCVQSGLRAWVKKAIGRPIGGYADNAKRNQFNRMLIQAYDDNKTIFDLASIEATLPDNSSCTYKYKGAVYKALAAKYASDGRHLNDDGSKHVASRLISFLITLMQN